MAPVGWLKGEVNSALRFLLCHGFSGLLPLYIVTEYPRSGGTWFSQMISDYLGVPFPRNQLPRFESCVMHGHYLPSWAMKNVFVVFRDGRDVMVSYYFYSFFKNERSNARLVEITRKRLPFARYEDIRSNLPRFMEHTFFGKSYPRFTWSQFVKSWVDQEVIFVRYEDLMKRTSTELRKAIKRLLGREPDRKRLEEIAERYSFANQQGCNPARGTASSFLRKGIVGDWKNFFSREACELFNHVAGEELIRLGYEQDDSWVQYGI